MLLAGWVRGSETEAALQVAVTLTDPEVVVWMRKASSRAIPAWYVLPKPIALTVPSELVGGEGWRAEDARFQHLRCLVVGCRSERPACLGVPFRCEQAAVG